MSPVISIEYAIRRSYLALVTAGTVALFVGAWWRLRGREIFIAPSVIHVPVLAFVAVAVASLAWLRPHRIVYMLGVVCALLAFIGFLLASPVGGIWAGNLLNDPTYGPYGGRMFGYLVLLLPIGWVLLGASVASWKVGLTTYLVPGVVLLVGAALVGDILGPPGYGLGQMPPWVLPYFLLGWPVVVLVMLGTFGYTFS